MPATLLGLFFISFLAATVVPLSSEAVLSVLIISEASPLNVIMVATAGNWLGGLTSYFLGLLGKWEWLEKYFKVKKEKVLRFHQKYHKHGSFLALFCWLPFVGDLLAVVLGFARINIYYVAVFMLAGKLIRYIIWYYLTILLI